MGPCKFSTSTSCCVESVDLPIVVLVVVDDVVLIAFVVVPFRDCPLS